MKIILIVLAALVATALAAPVDDNMNAQILKYENDIAPEGYNFVYETSDGVSRSETGVLKDAGTEDVSLSVQGTVKWIAADGQVYTLNYIADENGFQPMGAHLPAPQVA